MENVKRLAGLILLTCISIALEMYIPRIDTLIVIVLLLLENREYKTLVCMLPLILLIQEGMGTQHFGASILFLAAFFALYRLLGELYQASTFFFISVLSLGLGVTRLSLNWLFSTLQGYPFDSVEALHEGLLQALYIPVAWAVISYCRQRARHEPQQEQ